jgi:hypothetical protein
MTAGSGVRIARCYDPGRMSSAAGRRLQAVWRAIRAIAWLAVLAVLAAGGAGLVGQAWHPPGSAARAELTYAGDAALGARLNAATQRLELISGEVEKLADEAKRALEEVTNDDPEPLRGSLQRGGQAAATIEVESSVLRGELVGLPGSEPTAILSFSNATLVRRSAVMAAVDAAASLADHWQVVAGRSTEAANLVALLDAHDATVIDAAAKGRASAYADAVTILDSALLTIVQVQEIRNRLVAGGGNTVLDEWIQRNAAYDAALRAVYQALIDSGGVLTEEVQAARHAEQVALGRLPPDRRTIIVILSEVTRGGLTEAVVAIEDAHGTIDEAIAEATPPATANPA